ncbi:MAG TPA: hypothetical protein VFZ41_09490 [Solirubrobacterales bacterium]
MGAVAILGALVPETASAVGWSEPVTISAPGDENTDTDLAIGPDGTIIAVWQRAECEGQADTHQCKNGRVQYAVRPPGGSFSAPVDMPGDPFPANFARPTVAVDGAGNAIAAWVSGVGEFQKVRYSLRQAGGDFGGAKTLADPAEGRHSFPDLAMAPDGRAVLGLERFVGMAREAGYAVRPPGEDFGPARSMAGDPGAGNPNSSPVAAMDDAGGAIAQWTSSGPGGTAIRYAQLEPVSAEFGATQTLDPGANADLAMSPSGAAVMAWNPPGAVMDLRYAFRAPGAPFGAPLTLPEPENPLSKHVAIAPDGSAVAAWRSLISGFSHPRWAAAPPGGPFGPPIPVPPGGKGNVNDLVMSEGGTALALWVDSSGLPINEMRASLRPPGGVFGEPAPLPGPPQGADSFGGVAAFDPSGDAAALWIGRDLEGNEPHDVPLLAALYDAPTAPAISATRPSITGLRVQPRRFRVARRRTVRISARAGTKIRFNLSEPATVRLTVQRRLRGVRVRVRGRVRCLKPTPRNRRRALRKRRCARFRRALPPIIRRNRLAGANRIGFSGRVGRRTLRPGGHRVVAVAFNQAGQRSAPRRAGFRVLRPQR